MGLVVLFVWGGVGRGLFGLVQPKLGTVLRSVFLLPTPFFGGGGGADLYHISIFQPSCDGSGCFSSFGRLLGHYGSGLVKQAVYGHLSSVGWV